ncbi:hypothetical protein FXE87_11245 [Vibrio mimicus]|nr:hypothetical protein FXE87_11245 [Vibrio mimicus]TXZ07700.1 hypothetical protein FXE63_10040 [Vibrio mimicus]
MALDVCLCEAFA